MLSGSSPFKDASEWLIFQRIIARDLRIPEYFSDEARDLIDKLLVCNYKNDFIVLFLFRGMIYMLLNKVIYNVVPVTCVVLKRH
jgi:hypothetical protein